VRATVLHVVGSAQTEAIGVARFVLDAAPALPPERYGVELLFLGENGPAAEESRRRSIPTLVVDWPHPAQILGALRTWRALRPRHVDIVHQHYGGRAVARWLRALTGAPMVAHMCGRLQEHSWQQGPRQFDLSYFDAVTAVSRAVAECCTGIDAQVVYPPIRAATTPRQRIPGKPLVLGAAGRLVPLKGVHRVLHAFAAVAKRFPAAMLLIAGDGPERPRLVAQARALGIGDRVAFLGWIEDITGFYRRLDLLAHSSSEEAFGMSVAEAMAQGVPVVATNVGGLSEIVVDGTTGLLVPPVDAALANAISKMLGNDDIRARMGEAAWQRICIEFAPARTAERLIQVYDGVLLQSKMRGDAGRSKSLVSNTAPASSRKPESK
jgi:glycosyltransferase involved in cell wall biosynthesis